MQTLHSKFSPLQKISLLQIADRNAVFRCQFLHFPVAFRLLLRTDGGKEQEPDFHRSVLSLAPQELHQSVPVILILMGQDAAVQLSHAVVMEQRQNLVFRNVGLIRAPAVHPDVDAVRLNQNPVSLPHIHGMK